VDTLLAPFIYYDGLSFDEVKQEIQQLMFNLNVPTRVGFQQPFTNLTFDLTPSPLFKDQSVVIGGKTANAVYGDFEEEMEIFNQAFGEIMMDGDYSGRPFSFPIPTYQITKDFDWDNCALEWLWWMTGKFGTPYFANFVNSDMSPEDARSMCCRLRLDNRKLTRREGGLFGSAPLTGSLGVVTINLPRLGYRCKDEKEFREELIKLVDLAATSLALKRKTIEAFTDRGLYPYSRFYLRSVKQQTGAYWTNHFETIGLVGMNEACLNLLGCSIGEDAGRGFSLRTLAFLRDHLEKLNEENGSLYNLEATPAEGVCYRLARMDKEKYQDIVTAGSEVPYYTNSTFLPVDYTDDLWNALDHQEDLQGMYTGGTVFHGFVGEEIKDPEIVKKLVRKMAEEYAVPYFTLTPTYSLCPNHGYIQGETGKCPKCGETCEVFSRVVGYYRPVARWNDGKQEEFNQRTHYGLGEVCG
jgi:ribonucleoside-triphosphate reductase